MTIENTRDGGPTNQARRVFVPCRSDVSSPAYIRGNDAYHDLLVDTKREDAKKKEKDAVWTDNRQDKQTTTARNEEDSVGGGGGTTAVSTCDLSEYVCTTNITL
jgi:hypothetical protein